MGLIGRPLRQIPDSTDKPLAERGARRGLAGDEFTPERTDKELQNSPQGKRLRSGSRCDRNACYASRTFEPGTL